MTNTEEKLRNCFDEMVVYKDLKKQSNIFSALSLPSFMRDWILQKFEDEDGVFDADQVSKFVHTYLPKKEDWNAIKNRVVIEQETVRFLAKVSIDIDIKTGQVSFSLPDFGLSYKDTMIDESVWDECKADLVNEYETWGMVELGYQSPDEYEHEWSFNINKNKDRSKAGKKGKIKLLSNHFALTGLISTISRIREKNSQQKNGSMWFLVQSIIIQQDTVMTKRRSLQC